MVRASFFWLHTLVRLLVPVPQLPHYTTILFYFVIYVCCVRSIPPYRTPFVLPRVTTFAGSTTQLALFPVYGYSVGCWLIRFPFPFVDSLRAPALPVTTHPFLAVPFPVRLRSFPRSVAAARFSFYRCMPGWLVHFTTFPTVTTFTLRSFRRLPSLYRLRVWFHTPRLPHAPYVYLYTVGYVTFYVFPFTAFAVVIYYPVYSYYMVNVTTPFIYLCRLRSLHHYLPRSCTSPPPPSSVITVSLFGSV